MRASRICDYYADMIFELWQKSEDNLSDAPHLRTNQKKTNKPELDQQPSLLDQSVQGRFIRTVAQACITPKVTTSRLMIWPYSFCPPHQIDFASTKPISVYS